MVHTQTIESVDSVTIVTKNRIITWDDVSNVTLDTCVEEYQNEYGQAIRTGVPEYYFNFETKQLNFKKELEERSPTTKKFKASFKEDGKKFLLEGEADCVAVTDSIHMPTSASYIQVFLRDLKVHEDKREEIRQACNLKKEDIEELEKTLLTNDYILQPCTQSTTATISTGGFMNDSICTAGFMHDSMCTAYDPNVYINCDRITIGEHKFSTKEVGAALKGLVDDYKAKELKENKTTNKEDKTVRWEKLVCKEDFCIAINPYANIIYVNPETIEPFPIGTTIEKGQFYYRLTGASWEEFIEWNKENNKEDKNMFNKIFNKYKFGKLDTKDIAYSMNGIAFRTSDGSYVVYNKDLTFTNVDNLVMDIPVFVMPVPLSEIKSGDVIVHYGAGSTAFVIVDSINDTDIFISDPHTRERKNLIPEKSIFGFDFVAKVMTPNTMFAADQSNPFGNMLPFILMGEDTNIDNLSSMMLFGQYSGETSWANQYLPLMLMNKGDNDMFKYMALMQMMNQNKETK